MTDNDFAVLPGFVTELSPRDAKNRWKDGQYSRFGKNGLPEKLGGTRAQNGGTFLGKCRRMFPFVDFNRQKYTALGTNLRFYIYQDGDMSNVTPLRDSTAAPFSSTPLNNPFSTTATTDTVTVAHTSHGLEVGTYVVFSNSTASPIDLILINGEYQVVSVIDANTYTIDSGVIATNSEAGFGDGSVDYDYEINAGDEYNSVGAGFGGGPFNAGTFGTPRTSSGITNIARTVAIDGWGEDILFNPRGKQIYIWDTSVGVATRCTLISQAPSTNEFIVVSPEDRHLISLGAHDGANSDPMLVRWCSQEDYTLWTPSATNTAGDKRLERGNRLITAIYARKQIIILSDTGAYSMMFIGYPDVYSFDHLQDNCGAISPNCIRSVGTPNGDTVYWMSDDNFYQYDGSVQLLACDVYDYVFKNFNKAQKDLVTCGVNTAFNEVWWKYPSANSSEVDRVVIYNYQLKCWYYNTMLIPKTVMIDKSASFSTPLAAGANGTIYAMETGVDEDNLAVNSYVKSFDFEMGEGKNSFVSRIIMDFKTISGTIYVKLSGKEYPMDLVYKEKGPVAFTSGTSKQNIRIRANQISMEIYSRELGDNWAINIPQAAAQPMGLR